jgi:AraC-like DNA-binding protein
MAHAISASFERMAGAGESLVPQRRRFGRVQMQSVALARTSRRLEVAIPRSGALILQRSGSSAVAWRNGGVKLETLDWAVVPGPMLELESADDGAILLLHGEEAESGWSRTLELTRAAGRCMGGSGMGRVAGNFLASLADAADTIDSAQGDEISRIALQLVRSAAWENRDRQRGVSSRHALLARAQAYIARNLADPELSVDRVAGALNCTKRYIHKAFSDSGETVAGHIWGLRLERCREDLSTAARRPITDIAFSWGFNSSSHFSRLFRERFGASPRSYRATAIASA